MKNKYLNKKATSIVEAMVVTLIVALGVTGTYNIYTKSTKFSTGIENKIQAIQIAREGIEAVNNIRDTNWIIFSGDNDNCWNVLNYTTSCIGDTSTGYDIGSGSYKIYRDNFDRWLLGSGSLINNYPDSTYRTFYEIGKNSNGLYTQTGVTTGSLKPLFTREIQISYIDTNGDGNTNSNDEKMEVKSLVQWVDNSSTFIRKIELKTILTNWKN